MKRIIIYLVAITFAYQLQAQNSEYDFWDGDFCYKILSEADKTVELVQNQTPCWYGYTGKITIPDSVEYNGNYYQVISFGSYVFYGSDISIKFPKGLLNIADNCFYGAKLQSIVVLPDSLKTIGRQAFFVEPGVTKIIIPASVKYISIKAFSCETLDSVIVDRANRYYKSVDGVLYSKTEPKILYFPMSRRGSFAVPDWVTCIGRTAFLGSYLSSIILPNTLKKIERSAFVQCRYLSNLNIPSSVEDIQGGAIRCCCVLSNLSVDSLNPRYKVIENMIYTIDGDTLVTAPLPTQVPNASDILTIPQGTKVIEKYALGLGENATMIQLPEGLREIKQFAFTENNLRRINFPNSLKIIDSNAFNSCGYLSYFTGGDSLERIEYGAFAYCNSFRKEIVFPKGLKYVGAYAFYDTPLKIIEFTGEVDTLLYPFEIVSSIKLVNQQPPYISTMDEDVTVLKVGKVIIPCGATQAYMSDPNWSSFNLVEDCDGIEDADPQSAVQVVVQHNSIDVYNAENYSVAIYDVMGRCHASESATGQSLRHYSLPTAGVYVVHINGKGYKVVVK